MAIEKKERYIVRLEGGKEMNVRMNVLACSFAEILQMFGEENIRGMEKLDFEEEAE